MVTQSEAQAIINKHFSYYATQSGVTGMGFDGTYIIIYVTQLTPQLNSFLPKTLENVPVRIVTTGGRITPLL